MDELLRLPGGEPYIDKCGRDRELQQHRLQQSQELHEGQAIYQGIVSYLPSDVATSVSVRTWSLSLKGCQLLMAVVDLLLPRVLALFPQIVNADYFAPLLTVNRHSSSHILEQIPAVETFATLSNWLIRPVPTVMDPVQQFRERYFEDNYVIGRQTENH